MKRLAIFGLALGLILGSLVVWGSRLSASSDRDSVIRLGATLPLTGDLSSYGKLIADGIELAKEAVAPHMERLGYTLEVKYADVPLPGQPAVTAIQHLVSVQHIDGLAGNFWNPAIPAMAPIIDHKQIVTFHTAATDDLILSSSPYIMGTNGRIRDEARLMASYAVKTLGAQRIAVLYVLTTFGDTYRKYFVERFTELGGSITYSQGYSLEETDYRTSLVKIRASNPDAVYLGFFGTLLGRVIKQAREEQLRQQLLSVYESDDPAMLGVAGEAAEGLLFYTPEPTSPSEARQNFIEAFRRRYGYTPGILGANAYDATTLLAKALAKCRKNAQCAREALHSESDYEGASGKISIESDGGATKEYTLKTIKEGKVVIAAP